MSGECYPSSFYPGHKPGFYAHVIAFHALNMEYDPFGGQVEGVLKMSCSVMLKGRFKRSGMEMESAKFYVESPDGSKDSFFLPIEFDEFNEEDTYVFLPILKIFGIDTEMADIVRLGGLLLLPARGKGGRYTRVGCFSLMNGRERNLTRFSELLDSFGQATAEARCAEVLPNPAFPDERYVIMIA